MVHYPRFALVIAPLMAALAACDDDDGTPAPMNAPPGFTSATSATVAENETDTGYVAMATDPDGDTITYAIASGADAAAFMIDAASGALSFVTAPDFEAASDSDGDNVFFVDITASDGEGGMAMITVEIEVTDAIETTLVRYLDQVFENVDVTPAVQFGEAAQEGGDPLPLLMDIYTPQGDAETNRPVMIVAFGGGFVVGERAEVAFLAADFARRGYVAAAIDYRLIPFDPNTGLGLTVDTPAEAEIAIIQALHDMKAAVRFFREDAAGEDVYSVNPDTIFTSGISAGGVLASLSAVFDDLDVVDDDEVTAFLVANNGAAGNSSDNADEFSSDVQGALSISGSIGDLDWIDTNSAPLYAAHETLDPVVPCETMVTTSVVGVPLSASGGCVMIPAYEALGVPSGSFIVEREAHVGFTPTEFATFLREAAALFLPIITGEDAEPA